MRSAIWAKVIFILNMLSSSVVRADCCCQDELFRHQFFIGPEIYYAKRETDLGAHQNGWLYGGRLGYDYRYRLSF